MDKKLYIKAMKPPYGLYYQELTVFLEDFSSEEELIRHIFDCCGEGEYYFHTHKQNGNFSKALWKGFIKDLGFTEVKFSGGNQIISYHNRLEDYGLKDLGLSQKRSQCNHKLKV